MKPGELLWFDNKQLHELYNDLDHERIHLFFDLLPENVATYLSSIDSTEQINLDVA